MLTSKLSDLILRPGILIVLVLSFFQCSDRDIKKGNACLSVGDYKLAKTFFGKDLIRNPLSFQARFGMGKTLLQQLYDNESDTTLWKDALMHLEAARSLNPSEDLSILLSDAWYERSRISLVYNDTLGALSALSRSLELYNKNVTAINSTGILYFRENEIEKAETLFKKVISIDSTNAAGYFNLGMVAWSKQLYPEARNFWRTASKLDSDDDDIIYWLANAEKMIQAATK